MRSTNGSELDLANGMNLVLWNLVDTEDLEVMVSLVMKVFLTAKVEVWVFFQEGLNGRVQLAARTCGRNFRHDDDDD